MLFDKDTVIGISECLRVLEVEGNRIWKVDNLEFLRKILFKNFF